MDIASTGTEIIETIPAVKVVKQPSSPRQFFARIYGHLEKSSSGEDDDDAESTNSAAGVLKSSDLPAFVTNILHPRLPPASGHQTSAAHLLTNPSTAAAAAIIGATNSYLASATNHPRAGVTGHHPHGYSEFNFSAGFSAFCKFFTTLFRILFLLI